MEECDWRTKISHYELAFGLQANYSGGFKRKNIYSLTVKYGIKRWVHLSLFTASPICKILTNKMADIIPEKHLFWDWMHLLIKGCSLFCLVQTIYSHFCFWEKPLALEILYMKLIFNFLTPLKSLNDKNLFVRVSCSNLKLSTNSYACL